MKTIKKTAAPSNGAEASLRLEWRDADSLDENPANWRRHPEAQLTGIKDAIAEVGWAGALLYNERTGRLIDGHGRKKIAAGQKVPVLIGSWGEAAEKKILATLDPISAMATADSAKLDALLREVDTGSEALQAMLADLAKEAGLYVAPEVTEDEVPEAPVEPVSKPGDLWLLGAVVTCPKCKRITDV